MATGQSNLLHSACSNQMDELRSRLEDMLVSGASSGSSCSSAKVHVAPKRKVRFAEEVEVLGPKPSKPPAVPASKSKVSELKCMLKSLWTVAHHHHGRDGAQAKPDKHSRPQPQQPDVMVARIKLVFDDNAAPQEQQQKQSDQRPWAQAAEAEVAVCRDRQQSDISSDSEESKVAKLRSQLESLWETCSSSSGGSPTTGAAAAAAAPTACSPTIRRLQQQLLGSADERTLPSADEPEADCADEPEADCAAVGLSMHHRQLSDCSCCSQASCGSAGSASSSESSSSESSSSEGSRGSIGGASVSSATSVESADVYLQQTSGAEAMCRVTRSSGPCGESSAPLGCCADACNARDRIEEREAAACVAAV